MALAYNLLLPCLFFYSTLLIADAATCSSDKDEACAAKEALAQDVLDADKTGIELLQKVSALAEKPKAEKSEKQTKTVNHKSHHADKDEELKSLNSRLQEEKANIDQMEGDLEEELETAMKKLEKEDELEKVSKEKGSSSKSDSKDDQKKHTEKKHKKSDTKETAESDYALPTVDYLLLAKEKWCNNQFDAQKIKNGPAGNGFTLESCKAACTNDALCNAFSFDVTGGWCATYHKCGTPTSNPNGHWQETKGFRTYEKVFMPKVYEQEDASDSSKNSSKTESGSKKNETEAAEAHLQESEPPEPAANAGAVWKPVDAYKLLAEGKWCNVEDGGILEFNGSDGYTFKSCQDACTKQHSCTTFSFDDVTSWCSTFKKCGHPTEQPPSKKTSQGAHQNTSGWVTYRRMSEREFNEFTKASEEARLKEEKKEEKAKEKKEFEREVEQDFQVLAKRMWCDTKGSAVRNKRGVAAGDYTLEKCKKACARSETCEAFSFDSTLKWCTTFAKCGKVTSTPNGKVQDTSGMVTYAKWSDAFDIAIEEGMTPLAWQEKDDEELETTLPGTGPDNKPVSEHKQEETEKEAKK